MRHESIETSLPPPEARPRGSPIVARWFRPVRLLGLEPRTNGLKVATSPEVRPRSYCGQSKSSGTARVDRRRNQAPRGHLLTTPKALAQDRFGQPGGPNDDREGLEGIPVEGPPKPSETRASQGRLRRSGPAWRTDCRPPSGLRGGNRGRARNHDDWKSCVQCSADEAHALPWSIWTRRNHNPPIQKPTSARPPRRLRRCCK
jgi:hypothetical protein